VSEQSERRPYPIERLDVVLIRPAKYDDDGYVIRHWRAVVPCNTISCLNGLTEAAAASDRFAGRVDIRVHAHDETGQRVVPEKITRRLRRRSNRILACLVGVQSNQFPRAADLARRFVAAGCTVMIGGFHVSGSLALSKRMPTELQELLDAGVTLVKGEVEEVWADILEDVVMGRVKPVYDIVNRPELENAPAPRIPAGYMNAFIASKWGTIDTGRGCPFDCGFCTVINVQGRKMRFRNPDTVLRAIRENYRGGKGIRYYIITDDNFSRNVHWEKILDGLIEMRENEGISIQFFMQLDTKAYRLPNLVQKAARAGCTQVFVGIESLNPRNIETTGKSQNAPDNYEAMVEAWHSAGVHVHAAYITGFPYDTPETIVSDAERLATELHADQASFFMMTPLPGSRDYAEALAAGTPMDGDFNRYDSLHAVWDHPTMTREQWVAAHQETWKRFYTLENMKRILLHANIQNYWGVFTAFVWCRAAMIEGGHPMATGFWRIKDRTERRPGFSVDSRWTHMRKRWPEVRRLIREWVKLFFEMQELWLQTRIPSEKAKTRAAWRAHLGEDYAELKRHFDSARQKINVSVGYVKAVLEHNIGSLRSSLPSVSLPEAGRRLQRTGHLWWHRFLEKFSSFSVRGISTRQHLDRFWRQTTTYLKRRAYWRINPFLVFWNFWRDLRLSVSFTFFLLAERVL
jgi:radical SAM superfamily enzyme YgiQ (UPF0313 family)